MWWVPTLFLRDDSGYVVPVVNPNCQDVIDGDCFPTRRYKGEHVFVHDGIFGKRVVVPVGGETPHRWRPWWDNPAKPGERVGWVPVSDTSPADHHYREAWARRVEATPPPWPDDGHYILVGPSIKNNPYGLAEDTLIHFDDVERLHGVPRDFKGLRTWFEEHAGTGIVWHGGSGFPVAKLNRGDYAA